MVGAGGARAVIHSSGHHSAGQHSVLAAPSRRPLLERVAHAARMSSGTLLRLLGVLAVAMVLAAWYLLSAYSVVRPLFLPPPAQVWRRFLEIRGDLGWNVERTVVRAFMGFAIGTALGVAVALVGRWSRIVGGLLEPVVQLFKPIPAIAIAPFAILWFGLGLKGILFLVAWGCFFVTVVDASEAIKNVPKTYLWAAAALGTSPHRMYLRVIMPCIVPGILGGLRVSMVIAFNQTILGEFNAAAGGLGEVIIKGYTFNQTDILFLGIILVVLVAVAVDAVLVQVGRRAVRWAT
jgi:ABC-type nitrate/sulfonate/bicarbonate transport system permease component